MTKSKTTVNVLGTTLEIDKPDPQFECKYCGKKFVKEGSLAVHLCEKKKRHDSKGEPGPRIGLQAYQRFYESTQNGKLRTFDDFVGSQYYTAFVKFGWFCNRVRPISTRRFIDYVIKQNKKLDHWCSDSLYDEFLSYWLLNEPVEDALERAIMYAVEWSEKYNAPFNDMLRFGNENVLALAVERGRVSPWVIYSCDSGEEMIVRMNEDQRRVIWARINPDIWLPKLEAQKKDWNHAKQVLKEAKW